jgi:type IV fimbrial biogenesis protein FimT
MVKDTNKPATAPSLHNLQGYTMVELMVVVAIVAILALGAAPSLKDSLDRNGRESAMQTLITAIGVARSEAVSQGRTVSICRSTDQATCAATTGSDWNDGWIVFSDSNPAGVLGAGDTLLRIYGASNGQSVIKLETRVNGTFAGDYLQFNASGFLNNSTTGAYFKFCPIDNVALKARAVWLSNTGRPTPSATVANGTAQKDLAGAALVCP